MNDDPMLTLLAELRRQSYPLEVSQDDADALCQCIFRIMDSVPEEDQVLVRGYYDLATSALCHPAPTSGAGGGP